MADETNVFDKPSVERLFTGGIYILVFSLLAAVFGWLFVAVASQESIGVGGDLLGYLTSATAFNIIGMCISAGLHQGLSKYLSEAIVESKEKALRYAKAGFVIFNIVGIILFTIFMTIAIIILPNNFGYGLLFAIMAIVYFLTFFKDNFVGNLAAVHRFDYIGKLLFLGAFGSTLLGFGLLFLLPRPINAYLLPVGLIVSLIFQIILVFYYGRKVRTGLGYSFGSVFKGARRKEMGDLLKYGLYCMIPSIIFSGAILNIQTLCYIGFFGFETIIVSVNGIIVGYSGIVFSVCQLGWPQIPAVSEAKAMNDFKLIDDYMKNTLHNGFNITSFFLIIFIGLSHLLLRIFHGSEYLIAHWPFAILASSVALLGIEFLICTLLMGLGKGKQAAYLIISLTLIQIVSVPIIIFFLNTAFGPQATLYAGPVSLLISGIAIFPSAFRYLKQNTNVPTKVYTDILWKGALSVFLTLLCYGLLDLAFLNFSNLIISLVVRAVILFGLYMIFMLIFAGFKDKDLDMYKFFGPIVTGMRWLLHHSPFYEPDEEETEFQGTTKENTH